MLKNTSARAIVLLLLTSLLLVSCDAADTPPETTVSGEAGSLVDAETGDESTGVDGDGVVADEGGADTGAVQSEAAGLCSHPFYPIRSDRVWRYMLTGGGGDPIEYSITFSDIDADSFTAVQRFDDELTTEARWECTEEGLISAQYINLFLADAPDMEFETLSVDGVVLPPAEEWVVGNTWPNEFMISFAIDVEGMAISSEFDVAMLNEITAIETVTVPAGTFDNAVRVDSTTSVSVMGTLTETTLTSWYVEGVGLIRNASVEEGESFVMELVALE